MNTSEYILETRDLWKSYRLNRKTVKVLTGASLAVGAGERVAIMGRSGAGKSTLLHVLGGLDSPDKGNVLVCSQDIYSLSANARAAFRARNIGFVFQAYQLFPEMTVLENVILQGMAARLGNPRRRAMELLDAVGLSDRATHKPLELSGGEQQRVGIARALMNDPRLLLADEPTGNLDETTGTQVLELLFSLAARGDRALIIVTHDAAVAERCDRTVVIGDGKLDLQKKE